MAAAMQQQQCVIASLTTTVVTRTTSHTHSNVRCVLTPDLPLHPVASSYGTITCYSSLKDMFTIAGPYTSVYGLISQFSMCVCLGHLQFLVSGIM